MHGPKWPFLLAHGPGVIVVNCWDRFCTLGRAPRTKETLPDFREWCQVTPHPRVFRKLTGCQRTLGFWGVTVRDRFCAMFMAELWTQLGRVCFWVKGLFPR